MSLNQLKKIRSERVKRVSIELVRSKSTKEQAEIDLYNALKQLEEYKKWRMQRQNILFDKLQNDFFTPEKLQSYNLTVEKHKQKEIDLTKGIPYYEQQLKAAQMALDETRRELQNMKKEKEKIKEFLEIEKEEEKVIAEKEEENIVDELSCFKSSQR